MGLLFFNEATLSFREELASDSSYSLDNDIEISSELEDDCSSANMLATFSELLILLELCDGSETIMSSFMQSDFLKKLVGSVIIVVCLLLTVSSGKLFGNILFPKLRSSMSVDSNYTVFRTYYGVLLDLSNVFLFLTNDYLLSFNPKAESIRCVDDYALLSLCCFFFILRFFFPYFLPNRLDLVKSCLFLFMRFYLSCSMFYFCC